MRRYTAISRSFKSMNKSDFPVAVVCQQRDCIFYERGVPGNSDLGMCSHPNKRLHAVGSSCPLYSIDWMKKLQIARQQAAERRAETERSDE
jgi:hypothetical protein